MPPSRKQARPANPSSKAKSVSFPKPLAVLAPAHPPTRSHASCYHYPLLLEDEETAKSLLDWFEATENERSMPWRKDWIDPKKVKDDEVAKVLAKRAYEVWVSEIMLQQTRVSTVIPYFNTWISKWPTIQDLANADHDDVLSAWKGLGYYSRATRLHEGAKALISESKSSCPIPSTAEALQRTPGIGRYTAGAVSSIAFGVPEPVLDGNVVRVLSRQLGVYADGKDKKVTDKFWEVADQLVKHVSGFPEVVTSKVPGQWNQALMELGSTVCTPRPKCEECPIQRTCRAYSEGVVLNKQKSAHGDEKREGGGSLLDMEDLCTLCEELDTEDLATASPPSDAGSDSDSADLVRQQPPPKKKRKVEPKPQSNTISNYFAVRTRRTAATAATAAISSLPMDEETAASKPSASASPPLATRQRQTSQKQIQTYTSLFPKKVPKKKPAEQDAIICLLEWPSPQSIADKNHSKFLIEQRPAKGLLASLWQFPQHVLTPTEASTSDSRKAVAAKFVAGLLSQHSTTTANAGPRNEEDKQECRGRELRADYMGDLGSLLHVFTHLRLTMHVVHFRIATGDDIEQEEEQPNSAGDGVERGDDQHGQEDDARYMRTLPHQRTRWTLACDMQDETLSTGMRKCWEMFIRK